VKTPESIASQHSRRETILKSPDSIASAHSRRETIIKSPDSVDSVHARKDTIIISRNSKGGGGGRGGVSSSEQFVAKTDVKHNLFYHHRQQQQEEEQHSLVVDGEEKNFSEDIPTVKFTKKRRNKALKKFCIMRAEEGRKRLGGALTLKNSITKRKKKQTQRAQSPIVRRNGLAPKSAKSRVRQAARGEKKRTPRRATPIKRGVTKRGSAKTKGRDRHIPLHLRGKEPCYCRKCMGY